jgi:hypothetical protein
MQFLVPGLAHTVAIEGKSYKVPTGKGPEDRKVTLPNGTSLKIVAHLLDMGWKACDSGTEKAAEDAVGAEAARKVSKEK